MRVGEGMQTGGDISLRRSVIDWRDWWQVEVHQALMHEWKALAFDLLEIHGFSLFSSLRGRSDHPERCAETFRVWVMDVMTRLPLGARDDLRYILIREHAPQERIERVGKVVFSDKRSASLLQLAKEMPTVATANIKPMVRDCVLGTPERNQPGLRGELLAYLEQLESIALGKD